MRHLSPWKPGVWSSAIRLQPQQLQGKGTCRVSSPAWVGQLLAPGLLLSVLLGRREEGGHCCLWVLA